MTLDDLLQLARAVQRDRDRRPEMIDEDDGEPVEYVRERLARAVLDLLSTSAPCGWPKPERRGDRVYWEPLGCDVTPEEARAIAVMLIRAAGEVECGA